MKSTTTAQPPATAPGDPAVPDNLRIVYRIGSAMTDFDFDPYGTVGELKRSYREVVRANSGKNEDWPRLIVVGEDGNKYAAGLDVAERDVVVRRATATEVKQAENEAQEYLRAVNEIVAQGRSS